MSTHANTIRSQIRARLPAKLPPKIGVAVSGGGDSVALLHALHDIAQTEGVTLFAATVNHNLREEAADEARWVSQCAQDLGVSHEILIWQGWNKAGNLQDQARQARYRLLEGWARRRELGAIALGHTADDQAETFLMRLGRSAGVTGLSGMPWARDQGGVTLLRPMLGITRQQLRDYLTEIGGTWIEDPSNQDRRFDRIKARDALADLGDIGITAQTLARVTDNLTQARDALEHFTQESARNVLQVDGGDVCVDRGVFSALPMEIQRRLLIGCVGWIAGAGYPPRQGAVDQALVSIRDGETATIRGCILIPKGQKTWVCRELNAVLGKTCAPGAIWDGRWILTGPTSATAEVRALGEDGIRLVPDWRASGKPRGAALATPSVWVGTDLVSAPLLGFSNGWRAELTSDAAEFHSSFLSH